jgi:hypothetical protein
MSGSLHFNWATPTARVSLPNVASWGSRWHDKGDDVCRTRLSTINRYRCALCSHKTCILTNLQFSYKNLFKMTNATLDIYSTTHSDAVGGNESPGPTSAVDSGDASVISCDVWTSTSASDSSSSTSSDARGPCLAAAWRTRSCTADVEGEVASCNVPGFTWPTAHRIASPRDLNGFSSNLQNRQGTFARHEK